ncbi:MAG: 16S rRNA (cytosine(1402)-N(4))-methyltransferase RsmH [Deinococcus-Thermus bacterium]|jgi:16S rRNA (cytosine1402-N4)-methyltransferase|nr:16S rRNA (cytosine(1402)-N(4))-methyltransferase RsmH [Deinococcota bacterium]
MSAATTAHVPVLLDACLEALRPGPERWIVDATFGAGGHTRAFLDAGAHVFALDRDPGAADRAAALGSERLTFAQGDFRDLERLLASYDVPAPHGVLMDLGVSSMQLDEGDRGFAFRKAGPLDMRMSRSGRSAADLIAEADEAELAALLYRYGEERHSRRLARAIVAARDETPITTTARLAEVVTNAYPPGPRRDHPARRTFQALRIVVNDELGALEEGLEAAARVLAPRGRLAVLAYHSLEDRIVKHFLRASNRLTPLDKRPRTASDEELAANPRARAAKLRVAEKDDG